MIDYFRIWEAFKAVYYHVCLGMNVYQLVIAFASWSYGKRDVWKHVANPMCIHERKNCVEGVDIYVIFDWTFSSEIIDWAQQLRVLLNITTNAERTDYHIKLKFSGASFSFVYIFSNSNTT